VIEANYPKTQDRVEDRTRQRELEAADEATILDYVMIDFVDDPLDKLKDPQRRATEGP
jgi:hypothetical protein